MTLTQQTITVAAAVQLASFRARVAGISYERKGVLFSEMFFLYLCTQSMQLQRIIESGRARGQSTLLLSTLFPDHPVVSIEFDPASRDVPVAAERLRERTNVELRFGDATRILPAEVREGDVVLIDGPKGFRGLRLALRLLATGKLKQVFVHDCGAGTAERQFLDKHVPEALFSDDVEYARTVRALDESCGDIPADRRFSGDQAPIAYGYGLACIPFDPAVSYRRLLWRAIMAGFCARYLKHRNTVNG